MVSSFHRFAPWRRPCSILLATLAALAAQAADRYKANNNDNLSQATSWTNGAPGSSELAVWDGTVAAPAFCTNNLDASKTWGGVKVLNPSAPVKVSSSSGSTLSLNSLGINLNEAISTQDLWLALPVVAAQAQTWSVAPGRSLTVGETNASVTIGADVTIHGAVKFPNNINVQGGATLVVPEGATLEPTLSFAGEVIQVGYNSSGGTVDQTGGTVKINRTDGSSGSPKGALLLAPNGPGTYNISGGSLLDTTPANASTVIIGSGSASGTLNVSGTSVVRFVGLRLANAAGASGTLNLTNGSVTLTGGSFDVGRTTLATPGPGTVNVYGGTLTSAAGMNVPHGNGPGYFHLYGGEVFLGNSLNVQNAGTGDGAVTINGGLLTVTNSINLPGGGAGTGTLTLNGGTVVVSSLGHPGTNIGTLNLNGGTLRARAGVANFIAAGIEANVTAGGARIDSAGFNITLPAALQHGGSGAMDGGLTKLGSGTLILTASNSYNGSTLVAAGTLAVGAWGSISTSSNIVVAAGATLNVSGVGALGLNSPPELGGTLVMQIVKSGSVLACDKLVLPAGVFRFGGALTVVASGGRLAGGDVFDLFDAPGFSNSFSSVHLPDLPLGASWDTSRLAVDGTIKVVGSGGPSPPLNVTVVRSGTNVLFGGSGGIPYAEYYVASATNLAAPVRDWQLVATNLFDDTGEFIMTPPVNPAEPAGFFAIWPATHSPSPTNAVILSMLLNIKRNGFDPNTNINNGLGGLWINWRYGTDPLQVNFNGSGQPDGPEIAPPRHDDLTDLRYLHNLFWFKHRYPTDAQFDAEIQRYSAIVKHEFANSQNERGWIYDEELLPMWWLSGETFFKQQALNQAAYFAGTLYKNNIGAYYKTSAAHSNGYYRVDWQIEIGCALVQAGTVFTNADWISKGHRMVQFAYDHAFLTNYGLFLVQMDDVLLPNGSLNPNQTIFRDGDTDGGSIRFGAIGQEALSFLHVYLVTSNQVYLDRATALLDPLTVESNRFGLWDTVYGGYFNGLNFSGADWLNPGIASLSNSKKEAGRQMHVLEAFHLANRITGNRYAATEAALRQVLVQSAYYAPGHGVLYEVLPDWTPRIYSGEPGDWVTTEAMGVSLATLFSLDEPALTP